MLKKWLSLFGEPGMFLLKDIKDMKSTIKYSFVYSYESCLRINDNETFGVHYTPNGNLGKVNVIGEKERSTQQDCEKYIASFFIDIDLKDAVKNNPGYKKVSDLLPHILEVISKNGLPVQYIVESGGGYHLYMFINPDQRYSVGDKYSKNYGLIHESLAKLFDGGDYSSPTLNKKIRCPFTKHWKTGIAKPLILYKCIYEGGISLIEVKKEEDIYLNNELLLEEKHIEAFVNNMSKINITQKQGSEEIKDITISQINKINIKDIILKLELYPREFNGSTYTYSLKGNDIVFNYKDGKRKTYHPNGYKINIEENYVNNFSFMHNNLEERPRGGVFAFLYYYFHKDREKINAFLENEFGMSFIQCSTGKTYLSLKAMKGYIFFTSDGIIYKKIISVKKEIQEIEVRLCGMPLNIKGVYKTKNKTYGESEEFVYGYILENMYSGQEYNITFVEDRKKFNKKYGELGLMFLGAEMDLLDMYDAINKAASSGLIEEYNLYYLNGYYDNFYIIGDTIIGKDYNLINSKEYNIILDTQPIQIELGKEEISLSEFGESILNIFTNRQGMLGFITFLTLMLGHKYWNKYISTYKQDIMLPGLFLSGETKAGKSTMLNIFKEGMNLSLQNKSKVISIKGTTAQPLKQAGSDDFILHLEEFTGEVKQDTEGIIRDIINKGRGATGQITGTNVYYNYRASLILDGEGMPKSASVINRCITIPMFKEDKKGTIGQLNWFKNKSYLKDAILKMYDSHDVLGYFQESEKQLLGAGLQGRELGLNTYLLTTNKIFNVFDEIKLIEAIKENHILLNTVDDNGDILSQLLAELILKYRIQPTYVYTDNIAQIIIPFTQEMRMQYKVSLISILKQYGKRIRILGNQLIIQYSDDDTDEDNRQLYNTIILYKKYFSIQHFLELKGQK